MENKPQQKSKPRAKPAPRRQRKAISSVTASAEVHLLALGKVPESRAEMVARGRLLAREPGYPPEETIQLMSEILATHLQSNGFSY